MKRKKRKQTTPRGRRRFKSMFASEETAFNRHCPPRPYGEDYPVINIANRPALLKFFLPVIEGLPPDAPLHPMPHVPMNFAQIADRMLGQKQMLGNNADLEYELDRIQMFNNSCAIRHPFWNDHELPPELLRQALSRCAKHTVGNNQLIQRALARLYAVAWFGRGSDSVAAKKQLEALLPSSLSDLAIFDPKSGVLDHQNTLAKNKN